MTDLICTILIDRTMAHQTIVDHLTASSYAWFGCIVVRSSIKNIFLKKTNKFICFFFSWLETQSYITSNATKIPRNQFSGVQNSNYIPNKQKISNISTFFSKLTFTRHLSIVREKKRFVIEK